MDKVLWMDGQGRPTKSMIDTLKEDTGLANTGELRTLLQDRDEWRVCCGIRQRSKE